MFNNILMLRKTSRLICSWVATGNPSMPLACVWAETSVPNNGREPSSSKEELGRMPLCA